MTAHDEPHVHDHSHEHSHAHVPHPPARPDTDDTLTYYKAMEISVRELLIEKGVISAEDVRRAIEAMDARSPAQGARIVARAWSDPVYKARLLADPNSAITELGIEPGAYKLVVLENTAGVHNLVVCTLCSCYPQALLGPSPSWYKSEAYRARVVREPRAVLAEFGLELPAATGIVVHDTSAESRHMVLPMRPEGTAGLDEADLTALVTREGLIGTAAV